MRFRTTWAVNGKHDEFLIWQDDLVRAQRRLRPLSIQIVTGNLEQIECIQKTPRIG